MMVELVSGPGQVEVVTIYTYSLWSLYQICKFCYQRTHHHHRYNGHIYKKTIALG